MEKTKNRNTAELTPETHMYGMERLVLTVIRIYEPFSHLVRLTGTINPTNPIEWQQANVAVRFEIGETGQGRKVYRIYTIRSFDPKTHEIEVDFVKHEGKSPAINWLQTLKAGAHAYLIGPRLQFSTEEYKNKKLKLFADETAIPAIFSILSHWSENTEAEIYIESATAEAAGELPDKRGVKKHIYVRKEDEHPGQTGFLVHSAEKITDAEDCHIWIACEREEARAIRKHFMANCNVKKQNIKAVGYWRRGLASTEIEKIRGKYFNELIAQGKTEKDFDEFDIPA